MDLLRVKSDNNPGFQIKREEPERDESYGGGNLDGAGWNWPWY